MHKHIPPRVNLTSVSASPTSARFGKRASDHPAGRGVAAARTAVTMAAASVTETVRLEGAKMRPIKSAPAEVAHEADSESRTPQT